MKKAGIVTVLAGAMLGGTIEPELTLGADFLPGQAPFIDQSVFWKDIESGQAELGIRIRGLNEWLSGRRFSEDKEKNEKWDDELQKIDHGVITARVWPSGRSSNLMAPLRQLFSHRPQAKHFWVKLGRW